MINVKTTERNGKVSGIMLVDALVRQEAQYSISIMRLDVLLYLLGLRDRHTERDRMVQK